MSSDIAAAEGRIIGPVVVTGGAGFLGGEVIRQLRAAGCEDIRSVDLNAFPDGAATPRVRSFVMDIREDDLARPFEGARTVLHLAACQYHTPLAKSTYDLPFYPVNVDGTHRVVEAAELARVERLVFVSTNMVYGLPRQLPLTEDHARRPLGPYARSKLQAEAIVEAAHGARLKTAIVRPGLIVGPGRIGVVARVFNWILDDRPVVLIGSGSNRYEVMASEDVASLVIRAGESRTFGAYNCSAASVPTMREWIERVIDCAGSRSRIIGVPGWPVKAVLQALEPLRMAPLRKDQYLIADADYYLDPGKAARELGWRPRWGGVDAILETFRWYTATGPGAGRLKARGRAGSAGEEAPSVPVSS